MLPFAVEVLVAVVALLGVARALLWWLERRPPRPPTASPDPPGPPLAGTSVPLPARLEPYRAKLEALLAPGARIEPLGSDAEVAAAQLGGAPHLPADAAWPASPDGALSFIAELDLRALHALASEAASGIPLDGLLLLFYDAQTMPWGLDPGDRDRFAVLHVAAGAPPRAAPTGTITFPAGHMTFRPVKVLPVTREAPGLRFADRAATQSYLEHALALSGDADHRVRGFAAWIAQDGREEAALAASGFAVGLPKQLAAARRAAHLDPADWRLLLQLDTDPAVRFEWGDSGRLYLLARDEDVRARRFDRTWLLLQCS